jgi:hypothetical protein
MTVESDHLGFFSACAMADTATTVSRFPPHLNLRARFTRIQALTTWMRCLGMPTAGLFQSREDATPAFKTIQSGPLPQSPFHAYTHEHCRSGVSSFNESLP